MRDLMIEVSLRQWACRSAVVSPARIHTPSIARPESPAPARPASPHPPPRTAPSPCSLASSASGTPFSCARRILMICSSVNRFRFISDHPQANSYREILVSSWTKYRGYGRFHHGQLTLVGELHHLGNKGTPVPIVILKAASHSTKCGRSLSQPAGPANTAGGSSPC